MIRSIRFRNYRVLRNAELHLQPFTLLVGPNGSGKSTVLRALRSVQTLKSHRRRGHSSPNPEHESIASFGVTSGGTTTVTLEWREPFEGFVSIAKWTKEGSFLEHFEPPNTPDVMEKQMRLYGVLKGIKTYSLNEHAIIAPVLLQPGIQLAEDGGNLAAVLDQMRDESPERLDAISAEMGNLLPEFDRILFETPDKGQRAFMLRTREGHHAVRAADLSQGTVLALAILTLAYLPSPPTMVCLEEPDRGIHPRLYRDIQDALYRLAYPQSYGLDRDPVQVLVTTHSPYLLDLHRDHPEEIVIAQKNGTSATFQKLTDREDIEELLSEASLGELWYSGVLGGVPVAP